jgi:glycosyltransferase involved in cell wall biosynthesis
MNCKGEDRERLQAGGWKLVSPFLMSLDVFGTYPDYFRQSRGEFTVAKDQNVRLRSGWFSERDACYLASGKPVVAQDTGFGNILPSGEGLFAFTTMKEALAAIQAINGNYRRHCESARAIAEEYFAAPKVAAQLLQDLGF